MEALRKIQTRTNLKLGEGNEIRSRGLFFSHLNTTRIAIVGGRRGVGVGREREREKKTKMEIRKGVD